jgi:hypothetical protein
VVVPEEDAGPEVRIREWEGAEGKSPKGHLTVVLVSLAIGLSYEAGKT